MGNKARVLLLGLSTAGKDALSEILQEKYGLTSMPSSYMAFKIFIFDIFKEKYGYQTLEECYEKRHNHRDELFQLISDFNKGDPARLAKLIMKDCDIYTGMRSKRELDACKEQGVFTHVFWIDASRRISFKEPLSSCEVTEDMADYTVDNNGSLKQLEYYADAIYGMVTEDLSIEGRFND